MIKTPPDGAAKFYTCPFNSYHKFNEYRDYAYHIER